MSSPVIVGCRSARSFLDLHPELPTDRVFGFLDEMGDEARGACDEREAAHSRRGHSEVDERGARGAGTVDRQVPTGRIGVGDRHLFEQSQMRAEQSFCGRELVDAGRARVLRSMYRVTEAGDALAL